MNIRITSYLVVLTTKAPLITVTEETKDEYCTVKTVEAEICVQCMYIVIIIIHVDFKEMYHNTEYM